MAQVVVYISILNAIPGFMMGTLERVIVRRFAFDLQKTILELLGHRLGIGLPTSTNGCQWRTLFGGF